MVVVGYDEPEGGGVKGRFIETALEIGPISTGDGAHELSSSGVTGV
jgi:hypothetical protein